MSTEDLPGSSPYWAGPRTPRGFLALVRWCEDRRWHWQVNRQTYWSFAQVQVRPATSNDDVRNVLFEGKGVNVVVALRDAVTKACSALGVVPPPAQPTSRPPSLIARPTAPAGRTGGRPLASTKEGHPEHRRPAPRREGRRGA